MKVNLSLKLILAFVSIAALTHVGLVHAANDVATFESFYREPHTLSWTAAAIAALVTGIIVMVVALPAGAVVAAVGTSIGNLMGLSGIAATNAGLALLGGGSIVSGGLGVLGGTAVLTAALSFSTDVILDYSAGNVLEQYRYEKFVADSWKMVSLPTPRNTSGPDTVIVAGKALENNNSGNAWDCIKQKPKSTDEFSKCMEGKQKTQKQMVVDAINVLAAKPADPMGTLEDLRQQSLYALLQFINNNYSEARKHAESAYALANKHSQRASLPAFIIAVSMLYEEKPDFDKSFEYLRQTVLIEPTNPLTPVLFSAYLDRLTYRLNDRQVGLDSIDKIAGFAKQLANDDRKLVIQQTILSHYFIQLKVAQQRIISHTRPENKKIYDDRNSLEVAKVSMKDHDHLLDSTKTLLDTQFETSRARYKDKTSIWDDIKQGRNPFKNKSSPENEQTWAETMWSYSLAWTDYQKNRGQLLDRVEALEKHQKSLWQKLKDIFS